MIDLKSVKILKHPLNQVTKRDQNAPVDSPAKVEQTVLPLARGRGRIRGM